MTWPFENDTSGIVKKISESSIRSSKTRNIFTVVTIALASALLATVFLWTFGTHTERINMVKETAQIVYRGLSEQQGNQLYDQEEIEWVGEILNGPAERINNATVNFSYGNAEMLASQQMEFKGEIPQKENEIMLSKSFLDVLGCEGKLGQKISLSFEDGSTHEFVLSGIWSSVYEVKGTYLALVSKAYLDKMAGSVLPMDYFIGLKNATTMPEEEASKYALTLAEKLNISDDQTVVRSDYFMQLEDTSMGDEMGFFIVVGLLTLLGGRNRHLLYFLYLGCRKYPQLWTASHDWYNKSTDKTDRLPGGETSCCGGDSFRLTDWKYHRLCAAAGWLELTNNSACDSGNRNLCTADRDNCHPYTCEKGGKYFAH